MTFQQTIDYARRRFVELWVQLSNDHPLFLELETEFRRNDVTETVTEARRLLDQGEKFPSGWNAIVQLQALDDFLAENSGTRSTGVDLQLGIPMRLEDKQVYFLYRRPQGMRQAPVENQVGHLRRWTQHHWVIPENLRGYRILCVKPSDYLFQQLLLMHERRERLKVAIGRFEDGVTLKCLLTQSPSPRFRAETLTEPEARWKTVSHFLEKARAVGAHVLVLPELTVPPDLRHRIQEWLEEQSGKHSLLLVLPGSFHEPDSTGRPGVVNRTELLDAYGQPALEHCKLLQFIDHELGFEDINPGRRIHLLSLPVGLLATPICLDFCEADQPLPELWKDIGPAWLLVPAMGDGSNRRAHATAARSLFITRGSVTVLANQPKTSGTPAPGFVCESLRNDPTKWRNEPGVSFEVVEVNIHVEES